MNGYGLSPVRFTSFFIANSGAVYEELSTAAGAEAAVELTDNAFTEARGVMDKIPEAELTGELCGEILASAVKNAAACAAGPEQGPARAARPEEPAMERTTGNPVPPAGWTKRDGLWDERGGEASLWPVQEPPAEPAPDIPPDEAALWPIQEPSAKAMPDSEPARASKELPASQSPEEVRAELADRVEEKHKGLPRGVKLLLLAVLLLVTAALLWALAGVLMGEGVIPRLELGYEWFNRTVYPFF